MTRVLVVFQHYRFVLTAFALLAVLAAPMPYEARAQNEVQGQTQAPPSPELSAPSTQDIPPLIPTLQFAGRSSYEDAAISADGQTIAIREIIRDDDRGQITLFNADTSKPYKRYALPKGLGVEWMQWAGNDKLIFSLTSQNDMFGAAVPVSRVYVRNVVNDEVFRLKVDDGVMIGGKVIHVAKDASFALLSIQTGPNVPHAIYRYELKKDGAKERVVEGKQGITYWYADSDGVVRIGMGWIGKRLRVYYRPDADSELKLVARIKDGEEADRYWSVYRVEAGSDNGYVVEEGENGRAGVRLFDYSTGKAISTFYENPDWDVEELWLKPDGSPLAALYTDDRERIVWFDEDTARLSVTVKEQLGMEDVRIYARSQDDSRILLWAGNEANPGAIYLYTPEDNRLDLISKWRSDLDTQHLVRSKPVKYNARDGLEISAYLTLPRGREAKGLPLIILPHGGPFGVRDSLDYNDEVQLLANRGYAVLQPNFRGSGGYGDEFKDAGNGEIGRKMQDDLDDAMDWAVGQGLADPKRVCVVGGSYGGYAALWSVLRNPERYACAASWAGVTDWGDLLEYDRTYLSSKDNVVWRKQVLGEEDVSINTVSAARKADELSRPVLLAHGTEDPRVPIAQYDKFREAAADAPAPLTTLKIKGEGHGFSELESEKRWYDALDAFLAKHNPADQVDADGKLKPIEAAEGTEGTDAAETAVAAE